MSKKEFTEIEITDLRLVSEPGWRVLRSANIENYGMWAEVTPLVGWARERYRTRSQGPWEEAKGWVPVYWPGGDESSELQTPDMEREDWRGSGRTWVDVIVLGPRVSVPPGITVSVPVRYQLDALVEQFKAAAEMTVLPPETPDDDDDDDERKDT